MQETKKNYDSGFCGNVPLNFVNHVQSYGVLLVLDKESLSVVQLSENIHDLLGIHIDDILNKSILSFVEDADAIAQKLQRKDIKGRTSLYVTINAHRCMAIVHYKEKQLLLEVEILSQGSTDFYSVYQEVKRIVDDLKNTKSIDEVCAIAASEIKQLSGFDKVMIYQFDNHWNGHVVAESREEDMVAYLGLVFPASDVPRQARELYLKNPYRCIPDVDYTQVKLLPSLNPLSFTYTDLGDCNLRSIVPVHIEYLKNMHIKSSMSTAIIKDEKLWGLIACHHKEAKLVSPDIRASFELLSHYLSTHIAAKQREQELKVISKDETALSALYKSMVTSPDFVSALWQSNPNSLDLLEASGMAVFYEDQLNTFGQVPTDAQLKEILYWLKLNNHDKIVALNAYKAEIDIVSDQNGPVAGFLAIPISVKKGEYLLAFRPEVIHTIQWGGNPNEAIQFEPDKKTYHPRNSFAIWKETVSHTSLPWEPHTLRAAESLRSNILEVLNKNL